MCDLHQRILRESHPHVLLYGNLERADAISFGHFLDTTVMESWAKARLENIEPESSEVTSSVSYIRLCDDLGDGDSDDDGASDRDDNSNVDGACDGDGDGDGDGVLLRTYQCNVGHTYARMSLLNPDEKSVCVLVHYDAGPDCIRTRTFLKLIVNIVAELAFDVLRTQHQLGYNVCSPPSPPPSPSPSPSPSSLPVSNISSPFPVNTNLI